MAHLTSRELQDIRNRLTYVRVEINEDEATKEELEQLLADCERLLRDAAERRARLSQAIVALHAFLRVDHLEDPLLKEPDQVAADELRRFALDLARAVLGVE